MPSAHSTLLQVINVDSLGCIFLYISLSSYRDMPQFILMMGIQVVFNLEVMVSSPSASIAQCTALYIDSFICRIVSQK